MKFTLTVFVALFAALSSAPVYAGNSKNPQLTVTEIKGLKLDAKQLTQARKTATRDGVISRVERAQIQNLQQELNRDRHVYTSNRQTR